MAFEIGSIVATPLNPRRGESTKFEVFDPQGQALEGRADVRVTLNGVPGALQWLQFVTSGRHTVVAQAISGSTRDQKTITVIVGTATVAFKPTATVGDNAQLALMRLTQSQTNPYVATFTLGAEFGHGAMEPSRIYRIRDRQLTVIASPSPVRRLTSTERSAALRRIRVTSPMMRSPLGRELAEASTARDALSDHVGIRTRTGRRVETNIPDLRSELMDSVLDRVRESIRARYQWTFGDGTTAVTNVPYVTHDYFHQMRRHTADPARFHVTCKVDHEGIEVKRTLNLVSAYGLCKSRGVIVPHITSDIYAHKSYIWFTASMTIYNVEATPLTLSRQAIVPMSESPTASSAPTRFGRLSTPIVLAPNSSTVISLSTRIGASVPTEAAGFTVYYAGTAVDGTPVRVSSIFEVPFAERSETSLPNWGTLVAAWPWEEVIAEIEAGRGELRPRTLAPQDVQVDMLTGTIAITWSGLRDVAGMRWSRAATDRVLASRLAPAYRRNLPVDEPPLRAPRTASASASVRGLHDFGALPPRTPGVAAFPGVVARLPGLVARLPGLVAALPGLITGRLTRSIKEGEFCDPDNLTEADLATAESKQLVCQLRGDVATVTMPGRFMNARKGDVILSPGGTGLIGNLLRTVTPGQMYSHSGIMTRNYDELTHSTASEELLLEYFKNPGPAFVLLKTAIKYMWPGVVKQPIEAAVNGENYTDPVTGETYSIASFSAHAVGVTHNGQFVMVPPLVVKPDPLQETAEVRAKLHDIADAASAKGYRPGGTPKSHYRLFCYTDPTIGQTATAPSSAGWAAGTVPSVCSSLIWMSAKSKKVHLETDQDTVFPSDLEQKDIDAGAFVNPGTPDGLYTYTADERQAAGQWLYDTIYSEVYDEAGWAGEFITDAADNRATLLCNTFANDDPDTDSEAWRNLKDANAVSPDNILWWDGPSEGGLYGYAEPLIYREPRKEPYPINVWTKVVTRGAITGTVRANGAPISGGNVRVYEGKDDITEASGKYKLGDVPFGKYNLVASKVIDGIYYSTSKVINLTAENMIVNLELQPPADAFRLAAVYFDFWGKDFEYYESNVYTDPGAELVMIELGPDRLMNSFKREYKWGGELRAEYKFTLKLLVGNVVDVQIDCKLYEGTDDSTDDLDGRGSLSFQVPMNETGGGTLSVLNTAENEGDRAVLTVSVKNERNNN
ncbi:hypothetical protein QM806_39890 [Rhodococcus sp. IEGM 1351]|uniref:hypothetical protein n=1 Tax=Rhodococcus sp. IEGM 1351 TaxID=3047089 RepID=UPI0024B767F4|nr:hypothetical protein [Rhodococcus sp. IEGM 1351]MDI9941508.1 hypothetical protein [Rhodococcus sp. IEGM 1351]